MHPLSWNVYGGHYKSVILLLDAGADIDADFDKSMEEDIKLTVLDVAEEAIEGTRCQKIFRATIWK
jgi:hypothetical protein